MQRVNAKAIVLVRRDYGEADRIITALTRKHGKVSFLAKGVRKPKSRLAGGIELFCSSNVTFIDSTKDLKTLIGSELIIYYGNIVSAIDKTMFGYEILKLMNQVLADNCDNEPYDLLEQTLSSLNDVSVPLWSSELYFYVRWLLQHGRQITSNADVKGRPLQPGQRFSFSFEDGGFIVNNAGTFQEKHLKLLRLAEQWNAKKIARVQGGSELARDLKKVLHVAATSVV